MKIAIASSGLGHVARGIETWARDTALALAEAPGAPVGGGPFALSSQGADAVHCPRIPAPCALDVTLFCAAPPAIGKQALTTNGTAEAGKAGGALGAGRSSRDAAVHVQDDREAECDRPEARPLCPFLRVRVLPCLKRGDRLTRWIVKWAPGFTWRWGWKSPYDLEQRSFWRRLYPILRGEGYDILHVQDPLLADLCRRYREAGKLMTKEILAHGTEESPEFLARFPYVQHLAPWHLEQALVSMEASGKLTTKSGKRM
jgi:hypothetical protein